jgi:hypothetical protein
MHKLSYKLTLAVGVSMLAFGGAAVANNGSDHANAASQNRGNVTASASPSSSASPSAGHGKGSGKLADAKLKACQKREKAVTNIMARTVDRATKQIAVFDKIATRTEDFYKSKGKTVSNYDALVASVDSAKQKSETDLAAMKTTASFKCDGSDPKGAASSFKDNLKLAISDLKAYKTAVKNLIVGVKSAQGSDSGSSPHPTSSASPSSAPSSSPSASPSPTSSPEGAQ